MGLVFSCSTNSAVVPAKADTHFQKRWLWIPAFAGMTVIVVRVLPVHPARRFGLVVAERIERIGAVQEALDRRARRHRKRRRQEHRLPQLLVPAAHADGEPLVAIEARVAENEFALLLEV